MCAHDPREIAKRLIKHEHPKKDYMKLELDTFIFILPFNWIFPYKFRLYGYSGRQLIW